MINLKSLYYALLLKRTGSFSEAARNSDVSQSAISQQISKLEAEIGVVLFDRQSKPLEMTHEGKGFLERAESLVLEAEQLWDYSEVVSKRKEGHIHLGIIPTLSPYLSPMFLEDLSKSHPKLKISIYEMKTLEILRGLTGRTIQAGIIATPVQTSLHLTFTTLFYERFFIFTSVKSRLAHRKQIALNELNADELWLLNEGNCLSDQVNSLCSFQREASTDFTHSYHTDSLDALRSFISNSDGLTIMPELATQSVPAQDEDLIKRIKGSAPGREISMVCIKGAASSHLSAAIAEQIRSSLPPRMSKKTGLDIIDPQITI